MTAPFSTDTPRYGLYFTPSAESLWWQAGCAWLGRNSDADTDSEADANPAVPAQPIMTSSMPGAVLPQLSTLLASPRRYGFHATLKAPFRLAQGFTQAQLLSMVAAFVRTEHAIALPGLQVRLLDRYLALCLPGPTTEVDALAMRCVAHFDALRAAPEPAELVRRRQVRLSARQELLLARWGYPFTEELYRFHLTLADNLDQADAATCAALSDAATAHFMPAVNAEVLMLDALTVCIEPAPGAPFFILQRFPFANAGTNVPRSSLSGPTSRSAPKPASASLLASATPQAGRLFYIVGPSGVGKDTLLEWLQQHLGDNTRTVFARRAITRAPHPSEVHEPIDTETFWEQVCHGEFSMFWRANGACYGVRREIEADMRAGRDVIVNGSRAYAPCVRQAFPGAHIVWITADPQTISQRLVARRRETGAALRERVIRATQYVPPLDEKVIAIDNSGALEVAGAQLLGLLRDQTLRK